LLFSTFSREIFPEERESESFDVDFGIGLKELLANVSLLVEFFLMIFRLSNDVLSREFHK